ncbi:hypothetical protein ACLI1A_10295 [Flavobacterium sp. RHBU_3]|uniref:hypothetical protein n=1 Tax=Flavobacterium sp. RHBU_3 TaxID=3391184 RepID=UPI0039854FDE
MESPIIQQSTDYSQFTVIIGNRPLNEKKIRKLVSDIENGFNMLPYVPSIVNTILGGVNWE